MYFVFLTWSTRVVSLCISPTDDSFASAALDDSVRFWDLRSSECHGRMQVTGRPCVAYDPEGKVVAVGSSNNIIKLFDVRSFDKVFLYFVKTGLIIIGTI